MYFKSYLGRRAASCWALPHISSFFNQTQDLRAPSADRHETLPGDVARGRGNQVDTNFTSGAPLQNFGGQKMSKIRRDF